MSHTKPTAQEKDKAKRLIEFLQRMATIRNKAIRQVTEYEKHLYFCNLPEEQGCHTVAWGKKDGQDSEKWLEIQNGKEPALPPVPDKCIPWVDKKGLYCKEGLPSLKDQCVEDAPNPAWSEGTDIQETIAVIKEIEDYPEVQELWKEYVEKKWKPWAKSHASWKKVNDFYSTLFSIYQQQIWLGEEYELVVGFGLLSWQPSTAYKVQRHLVAADVMLEFDAVRGRLILRPHTEGTKLRLELDMLEVEDQPTNSTIINQDLGTEEDDPWEMGTVTGVLKAIVHSLDSTGEYDESLKPIHSSASGKPCVDWAPALILRKRSMKGLTETLQNIQKQLEQEDNIPENFAKVAELNLDETSGNDLTNNVDVQYGGELFFPKPANKEQRDIATLLEINKGLIIQGPPGTGKSHTIANLICHLLATGKRTLITAKTPRALQVLERLVPEELRALCVNLLGNGPEERRSLESSVQGILNRQNTWHPRQANQRRQALEERLLELRKEKACIERRLIDIRAAETNTYHVAGGHYNGSAARIAELVNKEGETYRWFTDAAPQEGNCPISVSELQSILRELRFFTVQKRSELESFWSSLNSSSDEVLSSLENFPTVEHFVTLVQSEQNATQTIENCEDADEALVATLVSSSHEKIEKLQHDLEELSKNIKKLEIHSETWINTAIGDVLSENTDKWKIIAENMSSCISLLDEYAELADTCILSVPDKDINVLYQDAIIFKKHMNNGGSLGWAMFRPTVVKERKYFLDTVRIDGIPCSNEESFSKVANILEVKNKCNSIWAIWDSFYTKMQNTYDDQKKFFKKLLVQLNDVLSLEEQVSRCYADVLSCPELSSSVWTKSSINEYIRACRMANALLERKTASHALQEIETQVYSMISSTASSPILDDLIAAIHDRNLIKYTHILSAISSVKDDSSRFISMQKTLELLSSKLPHLMTAIERCPENEEWDQKILEIDHAWYWAQAKHWIMDLEHEDGLALEKRMNQIDEGISSCITELASINAWTFCFARMGDSHRMHMTAWQQSMKRLGKGTGKHANRHRREAQSHLNACREAVPAWVMPLHRVWDTVKPAAELFDVIIIDEASQCGMESLPLLYMAKKVVIVGDDKQIAPEAVGVDKNCVESLKKQFIDDYSFKSQMDVDSSLFDLGMLHYGKGLTLREHFRSMPEIIRFSNELCYNATPLIPLRQYGQDRLPPLEHYFVQDGFRQGNGARVINPPEAEALVSKIHELCNDHRYQDKSMGVIVLQGEGQARLIEELLLKEIGAEEMERRRLLCGNPYSFQGDERDVILLSLVAAPDNSLGPLSKATDMRRFNVAASRARDQLILFHSVKTTDLSPTCLRRQLLEFFEQNQIRVIAGINTSELEHRALRDNRSIVKPPIPFDSWFEVDVALELIRRNYVVLPQYEVAGKYIDLVIDGGQSRLALECDGDHWHGVDEYEEDVLRQRQLERCGWHFFRLRESVFYRDKEQALAPLWPLLEERGIFPNSRVREEDDGDAEAFVIHEEQNSSKNDNFMSSPKSPEHDPRMTSASTGHEFSDDQNSKDCTENSTVPPSSDELIEVEIGDTVVYIDMDTKNPDNERQVLITERASNAEWGLINVNTPIAQALLGERLGSTVEALLPIGVKHLKIIKIVKNI